jgi:predicted  nucleic acid-binding Zn-ribbon protein
MSDRIAVDRKEFEDFLAENQKLLERSQALMGKVDQLESENRQLRDELQATKAKLGAMESKMATGTREGDESLRKARETMSRLAKEAEKRISK